MCKLEGVYPSRRIVNMTVEELIKDLDKEELIGNLYYYKGSQREIIGYHLKQGLKYSITQYTNNDVYLIYILKTEQGIAETLANIFCPEDGLSYNLSPIITSYSDLLKKIEHYYDFKGYYKNPEDLWKDILKWRKVLGYEEDC
jgi:hypothetical protein